MYFFPLTLLPISRRSQRPTTQGHSSHAKYENSRKLETYRNNFKKFFQSLPVYVINGEDDGLSGIFLKDVL